MKSGMMQMRNAAALLVILLMLIPLSDLSAATITTQVSGNWSALATWVGGAVPGDGDEVVIAEGHTVTIDQNIGSAGGGLRMLRVGTTDGSTAVLKYDGASQPAGYKIVFASTGKVETGTGQNAYGIRFFGKVDLQGTPDHPLTIEPRVLDGSAYTFIQKDPGSSRVRLTLVNTMLRFLGDRNNTAIDARNTKGTGDLFKFVGNRLERSGPIRLGESDGAVATIRISGNVAAAHEGPFILFKAARNLSIEGNQVTVVAFGADNGEALIDGIDGPGQNITIKDNTLISQINADSNVSPAPPRRIYAIWLIDFSDVVIQRNDISAAAVSYGFEEGVAVSGSAGRAERILISDNVVSDTIHGIGIHTGITYNPGVEVTRNRVFDNRNEHIYVSHGYQTLITNNWVYGTLVSGQAGILLYNSTAVQITNNTLEGPSQNISTAGIAIGNAGIGVSTNVTIKNNILTNWDKAIQNRPAGNTFTEVSHNLFFADRVAYDATPIPGAGEGDVVGDPKYTNPASRDYHIGFGSAAIDRAAPAGAPSIDFDGEARPGGAGFDIGADEIPTRLASADLTISIVDRPDPATVGAQLNDTVTVTNQGPDAATNVIVTHALSGDVRFISATPSQGNCSGTTTCRLGSLAAGASATIDIVVTPNSAVGIGHSARVDADQGDPNAADNTATEQTAVNPRPVADLSVGFVDDGPVIAGENLTYKITVTNQGPANLATVTLTDSLPKGATLVSKSPTQGDCSGTASVTCLLGALNSGAKAYVDIVVKTAQAGTLTNTVQVSGDLDDPKTADNSATGTAQVNPPPPPQVKADLAVTVAGPSDPVYLGASWSDTVTITNNGPDAAAQVEAVFDIPLNYAALTGAVWSEGRCPLDELVCPLGTLKAGETVTLTRTFTASITGSFQNGVKVRSAVADPDGANNTAVETMTVRSKSEPSGNVSPPVTGGDGPPTSPPPASPSSSAPGFGCGMVGSKSKGNTFGRSDTGDLLLLSFPFLYLPFRRRRPVPAPASARRMF